MKRLLISILIFALSGSHAAAQDVAQRSIEYRPGDWITYPVTRFPKSVSYGHTYVFFGTDQGISRYNYDQKKWNYPFTVSNGMENDDIRVLAMDRPSGVLWCATGTGLSFYLPGIREWRNIPYRRLGVTSVTSIGSGDTYLWLESGRGQLYRGDRMGGAFWEASIDEAAGDRIYWQGARQQPVQIPQLYIDGNYDYLPEGVVQDNNFRQFRVTGAVKDKFNHLWLGIWGLGGAEANQLTMFMEILPFGPWVTRIEAMAWDGSGMWIGGWNPDGTPGGISFWDMERGTWEVHEAVLSHNFYSDRVRAVAGNGSTVWFGTDQGLVRLNKKKQLYRTYNTRDNLRSNDVHSLAMDESSLWVGTSNGVNRIRLDGEIVESINYGPLTMRVVHHIETDGKDLWVATDRGLFLYNTETDLWKRVEAAPGMMMYAATAVSSYAGQVWVGTDDGVQMLDKKTGEWEGFPSLHFPTGGRIHTVMADDDVVWFGTDNGLLKYLKKEKRWTRFTMEDGLPDNRVFWILLDGDYLWAGTGRGLTRFYWNAPYRVD